MVTTQSKFGYVGGRGLDEGRARERGGGTVFNLSPASLITGLHSLATRLAHSTLWVVFSPWGARSSFDPGEHPQRGCLEC